MKLEIREITDKKKEILKKDYLNKEVTINYSLNGAGINKQGVLEGITLRGIELRLGPKDVLNLPYSFIRYIEIKE